MPASFVIRSRRSLAASSRLSSVGCWWRFCHLAFMLFELVLSSLLNVGQSAFVQLYCSYDGGGANSMELEESSNSITS